MAGVDISLFNDFVVATNTHNIKSRSSSQVLAEAVNQTFLTGQMLKGKDAAKVIKSGESITAHSAFSNGTQTEFYLPNSSFTNNIENTLSTLTFYFRFMHDAFAYTKHEIELNKSGTDDRGVNQQVIDLLDSKRQAMKVSTYHTIESAWWTTPSLATMETAGTATRPYSIRTWVTEDGLAASGFTTMGGINPSTQSRWRNQVSSYTAGAIDTTLEAAFSDMWRKVNFESPPTMEKYITDTRFSKFCITTDINGSKKYQELTRNSNDRLIGSGKDLGVYTGDLPYAGMPVKYVKEMDSIGYASTQPRFFWLNFDYLYPVWHTKAYFAEESPMNTRDQPYTYVVHSDTWYQLVCTSRQRQGIVVPA